jgi:small-conductance mechanosensitive channel
MSTANWIFVIILIIIIILIAIGLWFPRGSRDWPLSPRATVYLIIGSLFFILLLVLINIVSIYVNWSDFITSSIYFSISIFFVLIIVGLFYPEGLRGRVG